MRKGEKRRQEEEDEEEEEEEEEEAERSLLDTVDIARKVRP